MPHKICLWCKSPFYDPHKRTMSCSLECRGMLNRKYPDYTCKYCGTTFRKKHKGNKGMYCSRTCFHKWETTFNKRRTEVTCSCCGKKYERKNALIRDGVNGEPRKDFFCSRECQSAWRIGRFTKELHPNYLGGKRTGEYRGREWRTVVRQLILEKFKCTCQKCLIAYWDNTSYLDVHHIVPYRNFSNPIEANNINNLTILCKKCHAIETNKEIYTKKKQEEYKCRQKI